MMSFSEEQKDIAHKIGQFYLIKNNYNYEVAAEQIIVCGITDLQVVEEEVEIHCTKPGLLLGKKCLNLLALADHLGLPIKIIESNSIVDFIIPDCYGDDYYLRWN